MSFPARIIADRESDTSRTSESSPIFPLKAFVGEEEGSAADRERRNWGLSDFGDREPDGGRRLNYIIRRLRLDSGGQFDFLAP